MGELNFRLLIEYDGSAFHGWQSQRRERTVQAELEQALHKLTGQKKVNVIGAGRTDAGVHARGQVASVKLETTISPERMGPAVNSRLPDDVRVQAVAVVSGQFDARRSAVRRRYRYSLTSATPVLGRHYLWALGWDLDTGLLEKCAQQVLGQHDFGAFAKANADTGSTTCSVANSHWEHTGPLSVYEVAADRFLHHMVRYLVGTMVEVARGRYSLAQFRGLLQDGAAGVTVQRAPASGLVLEEVTYPIDGAEA